MDSYFGSTERTTSEKLRNTHPQQNLISFGNITFDSRFDSGNLYKVNMVNKNYFEMYVCPDGLGYGVANGYKSWFYFGLTGMEPGTNVCFAFQNLNNYVSKLFAMGYKPVFMIESENKWQKIPGLVQFSTTNELSETANSGGNGSVYGSQNIACVFKMKFYHYFNSSMTDTVYFALCYPYTYSELGVLLDRFSLKFNCENSGSIAKYADLLSANKSSSTYITQNYNHPHKYEDPTERERKPRGTFTPSNVNNIKNTRSKNHNITTSPERRKASIAKWGNPKSHINTPNNPTQTQENNQNTSDKIYFHRELITYSLEKRNIELITISSYDHITNVREEGLMHLFPNKAEKRPFKFNKPTVLITARVHPGEVQGSHICQGILATLLNERSEIAKAARRFFVFKIIPMLNPDGVYRGHFRLDTKGQNLNRYYREPTLIGQPSIYAVKQVMLQQRIGNRFKVYIDLHGHAVKYGCFLYGNSLQGEDQIQNIMFAKLMSLNCLNFDFNECVFSEKIMNVRDKRDGMSREGCGRVTAFRECGVVNSYTIECSYHASRRLNILAPALNINMNVIQPDGKYTDYNSSIYQGKPSSYNSGIMGDIGRALCCSLLDYINCNPITRIPLSAYKNLENMRTDIIHLFNLVPNRKKQKVHCSLLGLNTGAICNGIKCDTQQTAKPWPSGGPVEAKKNKNKRARLSIKPNGGNNKLNNFLSKNPRQIITIPLNPQAEALPPIKKQNSTIECFQRKTAVIEINASSRNNVKLNPSRDIENHHDVKIKSNYTTDAIKELNKQMKKSQMAHIQSQLSGFRNVVEEMFIETHSNQKHTTSPDLKNPPHLQSPKSISPSDSPIVPKRHLVLVDTPSMTNHQKENLDYFIKNSKNAPYTFNQSQFQMFHPQSETTYLKKEQGYCQSSDTELLSPHIIDFGGKNGKDVRSHKKHKMQRTQISQKRSSSSSRGNERAKTNSKDMNIPLTKFNRNTRRVKHSKKHSQNKHPDPDKEMKKKFKLLMRIQDAAIFGSNK